MITIYFDPYCKIHFPNSINNSNSQDSNANIDYLNCYCINIENFVFIFELNWNCCFGCVSCIGISIVPTESTQPHLTHDTCALVIKPTG